MTTLQKYPISKNVFAMKKVIMAMWLVLHNDESDNEDKNHLIKVA